jgi:predicted nuclease of predicted toxin-antitoxin system
VKFLVDVNLPPRLAQWISFKGHEAHHLVDLDLLRATDTDIWHRGRDHGEIIVSKDCDFYDRSLIFGSPPQVFHIAVGNCSNNGLLDLIQLHWSEIEGALSSGSKLISMTQAKIEVFP